MGQKTGVGTYTEKSFVCIMCMLGVGNISIIL